MTPNLEATIAAAKRNLEARRDRDGIILPNEHEGNPEIALRAVLKPSANLSVPTPAPAPAGALNKPSGETPGSFEFPLLSRPSPHAILDEAQRRQQAQDARARFEARCASIAARLRERVGFDDLCIRSDCLERLAAFHTALVTIGVAVAVKRGWRDASSITVHTVMELVMHQQGIGSSSTVYKYLNILSRLGLIAYKGNVVPLRAHPEGRCDGTYVCIKLRGRSRARLTPHDFTDKVRDLEADIAAGCTVYRYLQEVEESSSYQWGSGDVNLLVRWALAPGALLKTPLQSDSSTSDEGHPADMLALVGLELSQRNAGVDKAAQAVARFLGDTGNLSFYRYLLWQLLRLYPQGQDLFNGVYNAILRAGADRTEGFAYKPGALLISRLKACGVWDMIRNTPPYRVGGVLMAA